MFANPIPPIQHIATVDVAFAAFAGRILKTIEPASWDQPLLPALWKSYFARYQRISFGEPYPDLNHVISVQPAFSCVGMMPRPQLPLAPTDEEFALLLH
jgi:hypothetical protein